MAVKLKLTYRNHLASLSGFFVLTAANNHLWSKYAIKRWNNRKKIKRCPICGAKGLIHEAYDGAWVVQCSKCFLTSPYKPTREEAIKAWNRRE